MEDYEKNADALDQLIECYGASPDQTYSESDTRAKIIDKILTDILNWPETGHAIRREEHVHSGYIDYTLVAGNSGIILEAKRSGSSFILPADANYDKRFSIKNLLMKQPDIRKMYSQVVKYALERGVQYCVLTNGHQWLIFPGVRTDCVELRKSKVIVFNGLERIRTNFIEFWNLLSYKSVQGESLQRRFDSIIYTVEPSYLYNAEGRSNIGYDRNLLAPTLEELLPRYFGDIYGEPSQHDMLEKCFVMNEPIRRTMDELKANHIDDKPGRRLTDAGRILHFYSPNEISKKLENLMAAYLNEHPSKYFQVLIGRVGIGKTTFLHHFFKVSHPEYENNHFVLYMDYRDVSAGTDLDQFFDQAMWDMLTRNPRFDALSSAEMLRQIYATDIKVLMQGILKQISQDDPKECERKITDYLFNQFNNKYAFLKKLATFLHDNNYARFIFMFDNVDQLSSELQDKVIKFAFSRTKQYFAITIVCMWEETYFASKRGARVLSTIRTVPFLLTSQSITSVLTKRLEFLISQINTGNEVLHFLDQDICSKEEFCKYLRLILQSILVDDRKVRAFLELLALGNIRRSLEMFSSFLTAGSLETDKIFRAMRSNDDYRVPFHEFLKCVMLGSKRYYSERTSEALNLFAVGDIENPSHFTRLRLLQWLYERRHSLSPVGKGFESIKNMIEETKYIGISPRDLSESLRRLTECMLIDNDIGSQYMNDEVRAVRITATGRYYLVYLKNSFAYIDLVMQDTPIFDKAVFKQIEAKCNSTDLNERFSRCRIFLDYLANKENEELILIESLNSDLSWQHKHVPRMKDAFEKKAAAIALKLNMWSLEPDDQAQHM